MSTKIQVKRGTAAQVDALTPEAGEPVWDMTAGQLRMGDGTTIGGNKVAMEGLKISRTFMVNNFHFPAPASEWVPTLEGAYLAASMTAVKCWIPLPFLKIGDVIKSYKLVGDATLATALTLDCKLVRINKAGPITTTDITNGAIVQITADGAFSALANNDDETVATDKQYALEILGTTGVGDSITVQGAEVLIDRIT